MAERPAACPEWQPDLAGWVTAQLPPEREARLRAHMEGCPACRAEAESLLAVAAVALAVDPDDPVTDTLGDDSRGRLRVTAQPSPELGDRILAAVSAERRGGRIVRTGLALLASAAAVLAGVVLLRDDGAPARLHGEEVAFSVVPDGATADAVVADDVGGTIVQLEATGLDPDVTYALWLSPPDGGWDERVAAGTFRPAGDGTVDVQLRCALPADAYGRIWATTPEGQVALDTKRGT